MTKETNDYVVVDPRAEALIDSLRAVGYSTKAAVADLIDNSITAGATTVWIEFWWDGVDSHVILRDDGSGMSEQTLTEAMRAGSSSPLDERSQKDLGRFGLGLKTASFSQCKSVTVASKTPQGDPSIRRWDLDTVRSTCEWRLLKTAAQGSEHLLKSLDDVSHGTVVLWEQLDRVVGDHSVTDVIAKRHFQELIDEVREHLEMTFHRFLDGPKPSLRIFMNGSDDAHALCAWDPFLASHPCTILTPIERVPIPRHGSFTVQGFVLPHKDKLGDQLHRLAAGPGGWNAQQGFYVYRSKRLVLAGSWLGLGAGKAWTKEEHYKLARIRLDLPNSMDDEWNLDVKKSTARPPGMVRPKLKSLAEHVRKQAREVFAHRGAPPTPSGPRTSLTRIWSPKTVRGQQAYRLDRKHPLVLHFDAEHPTAAPDLEQLLRLVEETVPVQQIWLDSAEKPDLVAQQFSESKKGELDRLAMTLLNALVQQEGLSNREALDRLLGTEPFSHFPEVITRLEAELDDVN